MNYWENRYRQGGNSGKGSRGKHREWKWSILNKYIPNIDNVIDVGCGDIAFMEGRDIKNYTGIDISQTMVDRNIKLKPEWNFILSSADVKINGLNGDVAFCHDMLFHIMDDDVYDKILLNLIDYSNEYISIFTWHKNPLRKWFRSIEHDSYEAYRDFTKYISLFENVGFELIANCKSETDKFGSMYIFRKVSK